MKRKLAIFGIILIFVAGIGVMSYPLVSSVINNIDSRNHVEEYTKTTKQMSSEETLEMFKRAEEYNQSLTNNVIITDPFDEKAYKKIGANYENALNVDGNGLIGYIDIPKINVYLPVQHGTDADTLEKSVGHVVGTSLPVGGSSTHAVLSAHSGMASSKLFSDIDQLTEGDTFYIHVLGEVLAYKVDAIHTVLPTDTSLLQIEDGKDYVTLVTCTPFGINTHRLLVRGHRVPYVPEQEAPAAAERPVASSWTQHYLTGLAVGLGVVAVIGGGYFLIRRKRHA